MEGINPTMKNVKVSVIIPIYNEEKYLCKCLDTVLAQSLREIEIICVDDGSTDRSLEILNNYASIDSRIIILKQNNHYAGVARNVGMQHASGKYFSFLDADDFFSPFLLEKMYDAAEKYESDIVICNINHYDCITGEISKRNVRWEQEFLPENRHKFSISDVPDQLFQLTNGWAWDKLFSAQFIRKQKLQFSETRIANDGYFVYMALAKAGVITKIDDYLVIQRINNKNSLSNTREESWYCGFQMLYCIKQSLKEEDLYETLKRTFLNFSLKYFVWAFEDMKSWEAKEKIYQCIQEEGKVEIGITDFPLDYYYNTRQYNKYKYIETHPFREYLTDIIKKKDIEIKILQDKCNNFNMQVQKKIWPFPYWKVKKGARIVLYGAGKVGQDYYHQILETRYCIIVLWMDKKFEMDKGELSIQGWKNDIENLDFDKIVVSLFRQEKAYDAINMLCNWGISKEKIIWKI